MEQFNAQLSLFAPWLWMAGSVLALIFLGRAWWICKVFEKKRRVNSLTKHVKRVCRLLAVMAFLMVTVGAMSVARNITYPVTARMRSFHIPVLFQFSQLLTLLTLLALPVVLAIVGYWKIRFLLTDDIPTNDP